MSTLFRMDPTAPCGGESVNGAEPRCCEVHLLPWNHPRITRQVWSTGLIGHCPVCNSTWAGSDEAVLDCAENHWKVCK
jgi:hypothetical protein